MIEYPFALPFCSGFIKQDDLAELRGDTRYTDSSVQSGDGGIYNILDSYPNLKDKLLANFNKFSYEIYGDVYGWKIGTSWLTRQRKGDHIHEHHHDNYQWSGILYYADKYKSSAPIEFVNPLQRLFTYKYKTPAANQLSGNWVVNPQPGLFVLFPSFIKHRTVQQPSDEIRYSMAFNIMPTQVANGDSSLEI